jgi:hypothetical protein
MRLLGWTPDIDSHQVMKNRPMPIPQGSIDRMMIKCGWRCCICRRFRPTKLRVDRIDEQAQGVVDDEDNLIVTCLSCHSDVHTKASFSRRFTDDELKVYRNTLVAFVAVGSLPFHDSDDTDEVMARILEQIKLSTRQKPILLIEAIELLLKASRADGRAQGCIRYDVKTKQGPFLSAGRTDLDVCDRRSQARFKAAIDQLIHFGLLDRLSDEIFDLTYDGYLVADELAMTAFAESNPSLQPTHCPC